MAKKTNKTTHVLDLLTNGASQENGSASEQEKKSDVQSHTVTPSTVTVVDEGSRNDRLSQEILTKLSEELEDEIRQESGTEAPQPAQEAPAPELEEIELDEVETPAPRPAAPQKSHSAAARTFNESQEEGYHFINVMEELLMKQDLDSILEQHGVCKCNRCKADVCALTLTALPSKYVVASDSSISPVLSYYENRLKISMVTELVKACTRVRENPRHEAE